MRLAFTSMHPDYVFSVYDTESRHLTHVTAPVSIKNGEDRPFGISWDGESIFVAVPRRILVFDRDFRFVKVLLNDLALGIHQILFHDQRLWMVSPRLNAVKVYDFQSQSLRYFLPEEGVVLKSRPKRTPIPGREKYVYDRHHYNSLLISGDRMFVTAHNFDEPSYVTEFTFPDLEEVRRVVMGRHIHGVARDDTLYCCDSNGSRRVITESGRAYDVGSRKSEYVRGLVVTDSHIYTTRFPFRAERSERRLGDSYLVEVCRRTGEFNETVLPGVGNVNDLRCLDRWDYAHQVPPFDALTIFPD